MVDSFPLLSLLFFSLTIQVWQLHGFGRVAMACHLMGTGIALAFCIMQLRKTTVSSGLKSTAYGLLLSIGALVIIAGGSDEEIVFQMFNPLQKKLYSILCYSIGMLALMQVFVILWNIRKVKIRKINWKGVVLPVLFLVFFVSVCARFFNLWPRWDSHSYFYSFGLIDLRNLFGMDNRTLDICGHLGAAFIFLNYFIKNLFHLSVLNTMYLSNIVVLVITYILVYRILRQTVKIKSVYSYALLAFAFVCIPYLFGTTLSINPEHLAMVGVLLFLLGARNKDYYICFLACYIMCNSRETCVPIAAVLIFIQLLYDVIDSRAETGKIYKINWAYYSLALSVGIFWLIDFTKTNWGASMGAEGQYFYDDGIIAFSVRISPMYIINQIKGIFLTNFTWLFVCMLLVAIAVLIFCGKNRMRMVLHNRLCTMLICGAVVSFIVELIFITHHNYRYYTVFVSFIDFLGIYGLVYITSRFKINHIINNALFAVLGIVMCAQCFITIDPVMLSSFPTITTGKGKIAYMPWHMNDLQGPEFLDNANYNFQIAAFDKAMDKVFASIEHDNSKVLIYDGYQWGVLGNTMNSIWGRGYEYLDPPSWGVWNEDGQYRMLSTDVEPEDIINPIPVNSIESVEEYMQQYDKLYYLEIPWGGSISFVENLMEQYPDLKLYRSIENYAWRMNLYQLK